MKSSGVRSFLLLLFGISGIEIYAEDIQGKQGSCGQVMDSAV